VTVARKFVANPDWAAMLLDTWPPSMPSECRPGRIIGFCLGGSIAYAAATKLRFPPRSAITAAPSSASPTTSPRCRPNCISAKGRGHSAHRRRDHQSQAARRRDPRHPGAQHGFHCDERASYDKTSAGLARPRSMAFFAKHLKK
jgi:carboxymethylenebutenolidase